MICIYGAKPMPLGAMYKVKINDDLSMNIPFKENVSTTKNNCEEEQFCIQFFTQLGKR